MTLANIVEGFKISFLFNFPIIIIFSSRKKRKKNTKVWFRKTSGYSKDQESKIYKAKVIIWDCKKIIIIWFGRNVVDLVDVEDKVEEKTKPRKKKKEEPVSLLSLGTSSRG